MSREHYFILAIAKLDILIILLSISFARLKIMNNLLKNIYQSGNVEDDKGNVYPIFPYSVSIESGKLLYELVRRLKPNKTIETGMAYGLSNLFICQALSDNETGTHTAIDPNQSTTFHNIGIINNKRAKLDNLLTFYEGPSYEILPRLESQSESYDFAFIDGSHYFEDIFVDFFYIDKMLKIGGHIAIDDLFLHATKKVIGFALANMSYELTLNPIERINVLGPQTVSISRKVLRKGRRFIQNHLRPEWAMNFAPEDVALLKKLDETERDWHELKNF